MQVHKNNSIHARKIIYCYFSVFVQARLREAEFALCKNATLTSNALLFIIEREARGKVQEENERGVREEEEEEEEEL